MSDDQANTETAGMIEADDGQVASVCCDVTHAADVEAAVQVAVDRFGGLDVAFNNAGIEQPTTPAADITEEEWDRVTAVNLRGATFR